MSGRPWTEDEIKYLIAHYHDTLMDVLMETLSRSKFSIFGKAWSLGICKSAKYLKNHPGRQNLPKFGNSTRFKPGNIPHNKGKRGWQAGGNSSKTRFTKGRRPHNWVPVGSMRRTKEGILERKISDTGYGRRDWKSVHSLLWEEHYGPIPKGYIVVFKNKDTMEIKIENLECISRAENMRRNTIHNLPEPLVDIIRIRGVLNRHINKRGGIYEKQD
jgi:hypothetical protein